MLDLARSAAARGGRTMYSLTVSTFPNAKALPLWAGLEYGIFAAHGLNITLHETGSSQEQRSLLVRGELHICQAAVDNAFAMIDAGHDVIIVMGGEGGMNDFIVQAAIKTYDELSGGVLLVDSPHTAYALLAQELLASHGLLPVRDYAIRSVGNGAKRLQALLADTSNSAAILNPPFSAQAIQAGMHSLGKLENLLGSYQAGGAFCTRSWAKSNSDCLECYVAAYIQCLDWMCDDKNTKIASVILQEKLDLDEKLSLATLHQLTDAEAGFTPMARLLPDGMANTIKIRAGASASPMYNQAVDLSFYDRVLAHRQA